MALVELWLEGSSSLDRPSMSVVTRGPESYGTTHSLGLTPTEVGIGRVQGTLKVCEAVAIRIRKERHRKRIEFISITSFRTSMVVITRRWFAIGGQDTLDRLSSISIGCMENERGPQLADVGNKTAMSPGRRGRATRRQSLGHMSTRGVKGTTTRTVENCCHVKVPPAASVD